MDKISTVRTGSLTFAPEAGSQRLRDVINKNVCEADLLRAVNVAFEAGKNQVKLYFMTGLPTEQYEDLDGIRSGVRLSSLDKYMPLIYPQSASIFDYAKDCMLFVCESFSVKEKFDASCKLMNETVKGLFQDGVLCKGLDKYSLQLFNLFDYYEKCGAVYLDNKLFTGASFSAGEFGHIVTHAGGKDCTCGGKGCYEAYASAKALVGNVEEKTGRKMNGREIFAEFENPEIREIIDEWIDEIVVGLKSLIYIFNPSLVVAGGGIMSQEYITSEVNKRLANELMPSFRKVKIVKALMGNDANKLGAAYLAGLCVGYWKDTAEIESNREVDTVFTPKMDTAERDRLYKGWKRAVERAKNWAEEE